LKTVGVRDGAWFDSFSFRQLSHLQAGAQLPVVARLRAGFSILRCPMHGLTTIAPIPGAGARAALPAGDQPEGEKDREIRFLGDLQRLQPKPGDVFVLQVPGRVSDDMADAIRQQWKQIMGEVPLLVVDCDTKLGCIGTVWGA
jgi:hypothetical protein